MKKLSVVLVIGIMAASMAAAAYAKDEPAGKFEKIGIHMTLPEEMSEVKGVFDPEFYGAISDDPEIYYMGVAYFAMPQEKLEYYQNLPEEDFTEEVSEEISGLQTLICEIFAVQGDSGDFYKLLGMEENTEEIGLEELGKSDEFTFFCIPTDGAQYLTNADDSFIEEYQTVYDMTMNALRNAAFEDPSTSFAGKTAAFKSTDLDGREVSSDELFSANEITMVNYWATWCGPCLGELKELAEIHSRLQEKGCGIVGILQDTESAEEAKGILEENGTNYPVVLQSEDMEFTGDITALPASFFVDRDGNILSGPIYGAAVNEYERTVEMLLGSGSESGMTETEADAGN